MREPGGRRLAVLDRSRRHLHRLVARDPDGRLSTHKLLTENPAAIATPPWPASRACSAAADAPSRPAWSKRSRWAPPSPPTRCSSARATHPAGGQPRVSRDALRIGNQTRPRLFDLDIRLPSMLYERVVEVGGRSASTASTLEPLDEVRAARPLPKPRRPASAPVAILPMHAWKFPEHERRLAELARAAGFTADLGQPSGERAAAAWSRAATPRWWTPISRRSCAATSTRSRPIAGRAPLFHAIEGGLADAAVPGKDAILRARPVASSARRAPRRRRVRPDHQLRHGRHLDRCRALCRRVRARLRDPGGRRACAPR